MNYKYIVLAFWLAFSAPLFGAEITGKLSTLEGVPLIGANVLWQNTNIGTVTDEEGFFRISDEGISDRTLVISYIGFNTEVLPVGTIQHWDIQMIEDYSLVTVEVTSQSKATRFGNTPEKLEIIGSREIERAACCSLAGCFSTNASVNSMTTNVVTNAKELRILGISGVYNQLLFDGMPLIQGLGLTYGAGSYPGTMIENIFISKGTNSVLQGFESISGQINILPPKPENAPRLYLNAFANSFGETQYNINHLVKRKSWSNFTTAHLTLPAGKIDRDGDGFRDIVSTQRVSFYNKLIYNNPDQPKLKAQLGLRLWDEVREGGTMDYSRKTDLGSNSVYGQTVDITQFDVYAKLNYKLKDDLALTWLNSTFLHDQESYFGVKKYDAQQVNFTSNLYSDWFYGEKDHNLKAGASLRLNRMEEQVSAVEEFAYLNYAGTYNSDFNIPGVFAENTLKLAPFTIISGIRADLHEGFGWKIAPRFLVRAELPKDIDLRFSIGKGFRRAQVLAERTNIIASNRLLFFDHENLAPEEALNIGLNGIKQFRFTNVNLTLSADAYYILFQNQIFPDFSTASVANVDNFYGESVSQSFQLESKLEFFERIDFKAAYKYLNVYRMEEGKKIILPFVPRQQLLFNASYSTKNDKWQFDGTYEWFGERRLPHTHDYPSEYRKPHYSETYGYLDFQLTRRWTQFEIYTGIENIFDFRQTFPILAYDDPFGPYFDPAFNWGPTKGREFYLGLRYRMK